MMKNAEIHHGSTSSVPFRTYRSVSLTEDELTRVQAIAARAYMKPATWMKAAVMEKLVKEEEKQKVKPRGK